MLHLPSSPNQRSERHEAEKYIRLRNPWNDCKRSGMLVEGVYSLRLTAIDDSSGRSLLVRFNDFGYPPATLEDIN
jgi:hypothetical protein